MSKEEFKYLPGREYKCIKSGGLGETTYLCVSVGYETDSLYKKGYRFVDMARNKLTVFNHINNASPIGDLLELIKTPEEIEEERKSRFCAAKDAKVGFIYAGTGVHSNARYLCVEVREQHYTGKAILITQSRGVPCIPAVCPLLAGRDTALELIGPYED